MKIVFKVKPPFQTTLAGVQDRFDTAIIAAANMTAAMMQEQGRQDIASSGRFGSRWQEALNVTVEGDGAKNMRIVMSHDMPGAQIFETGGQIQGKPLLWIGLSGTSAEGIPASEYQGNLVSAAHSSRPLLLDANTREPRYFGISSVMIPKKFHLHDVALRAMQSFRDNFNSEFKKA